MDDTPGSPVFETYDYDIQNGCKMLRGGALRLHPPVCRTMALIEGLVGYVAICKANGTPS